MGGKIGSKFSAYGGFLHFHDSSCAQNMITYAPYCTTLKKEVEINFLRHTIRWWWDSNLFVRDPQS